MPSRHDLAYIGDSLFAERIAVLAAHIIFLACMIALAFYDIRTRLVPNWVVILLSLLWLFCMLAIGRPWLANSASALCFMLGVWIVSVIFEKATKSYSIGGGDIKLMLPLGLYLGIEGALLALLFASAYTLMSALMIRASTTITKSGPLAQPPSATAAGDISLSDRHPTTLPFVPGIATGCLVASIAMI